MPIIDLHCDTIGVIDRFKRMKDTDVSLKENFLQIDEKKLLSADYFAQCFAMFVYLEVDNPFEVCINAIDTFYEKINECNHIELALSYDDLIKNNMNKKISAILTIEEGGVCKSNISFLNIFYRLGVRMICLNWNFDNGVGFPNYGKFIDDKPDYITPNTKDGLTEFGFAMVKRMNELGMVVDISHLSDKGFWDVINTTSQPIVASHSNARTVCKHVRNLSDDMIIALNKNGGVMGMNYCAAFLNDDELIGKNTIDCTIEHIKYIKNLVGVDIIALGSDFDGINPDIEIKDASYMNNLVKRLHQEGFNQDEIDKMCYKNALRVFETVLK